MPAGVAPAGSEVGDVLSSVRLPPLTAKVPTAPILLSSTYRKRPSGSHIHLLVRRPESQTMRELHNRAPSRRFARTYGRLDAAGTAPDLGDVRGAWATRQRRCSPPVDAGRGWRWP